MKKIACLLMALAVCASAACAAEAPTVEPTQVQEAQINEPLSEEPTPGAEATPSEEATPSTEPTPSEEATPSTEPTPSEEATPSAEPTPSAEATPSAEPTPSEEATPSAEPTPSEAPTATPEADQEAWLLDAEGVRSVGGRLEALLRDNETGRLFVSTRSRVLIREFELARLKAFKLEPDPEVFASGEWRVVFSASEMIEDEITREQIEAAADGALVDFYVWVAEVLPEPTPTPEAGALKVTWEGWNPDGWSNEQPVFTLEGITPEMGDCDYAAIIFDERIALLSENRYLPEKEGIYTVRFAIMNAMGDIAERSEKYALYLDWSAPELSVAVSEEQSYTMTVVAGDSISGLKEVSLDGGANWIPLNDGESCVHSETKKTRFAPGTILARDEAGNVAENPEEIVLDKISRGGGGGGGGESKPKPQHASGDGDTAKYNAYELELPEGEMRRLSLAGETVMLDLEADGQAAGFTAEMIPWMREGGLPESADTLKLSAAAHDAQSSAELSWKINGAVLRKLYNSGVRYLLLEAGGKTVSLPTEGFVAGTRYAELKMLGASTAEFNYTISMCPDAADFAPAFNAKVAGESYKLVDSLTTPEMYTVDVYYGPDDLPEYPYGEYPQPDDSTKTED